MANTNPLPTLDDFMEDSSTLVKTSEGKKPETAAVSATPPGDDKAKAEAAEAAKAKADAEATKKAADDKTKTEADAKAAVEAKKKTDEEKSKKAAENTLSKDQLDALVKKAEDKPETLTADERKYLLDHDLFEEDKPQSNVWEEVEKIHGMKVEVDFQGKDPESPEGIALRDQALVEMASTNQIEYLKTTYPEAFQILEHVANGGKVTDLITGDEPDYSKITLEKDDKEGQRELLMNYYLQKGFDEKASKRYVEADEDSGEGLFGVATQALKQLTTTQTEKQRTVIEQQKLAKAEVDKRNVAFKQSIKQITDGGKLGDFNITSKKDREEFYQFAVKNIYSDGGAGYQVVLPVDDKSVISVLQQLFFSFKGGKLDEFVNKAAQTQNLIKLKRKVAQASNQAGGQEGAGTGTQKALPTFDIFKAD